MLPFWYTKNELVGEKVNSNDNESMQIIRDSKNSGDFSFNFSREIQKSLNYEKSTQGQIEGLV